MILSKSTSKNYYPGRILSENLSETDQRRNLLENFPGHGSPYGDRNFTNQGCHMATGRISTQVADSGHRMVTTTTLVWVAIWRPARSFPGSPYGDQRDPFPGRHMASTDKPHCKNSFFLKSQ
ncbi:hypothetical protein Rs2_41193 [Raphanus sativus]|nr:hypothetical protein Rs2_41193 [Raphanus sativus]